MQAIGLDGITAAQANDAIEIAHRVWWVGHYLEDDPFQCHVYLIEHGDQSVLFDPGSALTFRHTLRKIGQVIPFGHIRYFVCHHQDPDITGALPLIDQIVDRDDAVIVTHWRAEALLRHYGLSLPFWRVEDHDWALDLGGRCLEFAFTPYAHFPGAYVTFDGTTGTLFSSDLFGGFTDGFSLVARDESYFEHLRPFHEHYIPGRDILQNALAAIRKFPLKLIAPQHGSLIPEHLIGFMVEHLGLLECGLYLMASHDSNISRLMTLNRALRDFTETMILTRDFQDIARALFDIVNRFLSVSRLEFYARAPNGEIVLLSPENRYRGRVEVDVPPVLRPFLERCEPCDLSEGASSPSASGPVVLPPGALGDERSVLVLPLGFYPESVIGALALLTLEQPLAGLEGHEKVINQMTDPLQVAVEREVLHRTLDQERQRFYETSIRDPLTGLFTRYYMQETLRRLLDLNDRDPHASVGVALLDLDHFKNVNDLFGHGTGDLVLRTLAECLVRVLRPSDLAVRLGGEEFAVFVMGVDLDSLENMADRLRLSVSVLRLGPPLGNRGITASFGVAVRAPGETLAAFLERADRALYRAKEGGRNRVCRADPP
ncbi:oxygen-binding di-iron domain-containing protein [Pararhodospirillum oryzae]|uniref:diguanylate cyclase n=1 Tax=Pararhodospirillum oryzae TaxID=478448 RepID=A0A512H981_9PROT|nr:diguanylate cyclase [Pararhodospirillum oryzae]GEO81992.1 hypothetical protein ROR02_21230 [Pararhodospirillum oryzae]